jgi:hypothetical protein
LSRRDEHRLLEKNFDVEAFIGQSVWHSPDRKLDATAIPFEE